MTIKQKVKNLWQLCFDDSEEFTDLYFNLRYSNKSNVSIQSGDNIIAALQMIPYQMTYYGAEINTSYISGACTHPEFRSKGVMKELLSQAFTQMTRKGIHISTLIPAEPWLFGYYGKTGYVPVFRYAEKNIKRENVALENNWKIAHSIEFDETEYSYFNDQMHKRACCIQHDREDYKVILEDLKLSGGGVFTILEDDKIIAMAFVSPGKDSTIKVTEAFGNDDETVNTLIQSAAAHFKADNIVVVTPADTEGNPIGMARIIYAKAVLQLYALGNPTTELNIELTDDQLSLNNGYYYLMNGKCMTTKKRLPGSHLKLTIGELTEMLLAPANPYMSLMLN